MRMRHRMRPNPDATIAVLAKLVPTHRRKLSRIVAGKLRDAQRSACARIPGADEDLDGHTEPLERRKNGRGAPKGVVEGRVHLPEARKHTHLSQQKIRLNAEPVLPGRRNGVVTEDERPTGAGLQAALISMILNFILPRGAVTSTVSPFFLPMISLPTGDSLESLFSAGLASAEPTIWYSIVSLAPTSRSFTFEPTETTSLAMSFLEMTRASRMRSSSVAMRCSSSICSFLASSYSAFSAMSPNSRAMRIRSATSRRLVVESSSISRLSFS